MSSAEPPLDPQRLRAAFHVLIRRFGLLDPARTPCGQPLAVSHAHALMELLRNPGASQGELASALGLSKSAVSRMVVQLQERGLIERRSDVEDARVRRLTLTRKGRRLGQRADKASLDRFSNMLDGIPHGSRAQVLAALEILQHAMSSRAQTKGEAQ